MKKYRLVFGVLFLVSLLTSLPALASETNGTIDSSNIYVRFLNSNYGSINFGATNGNVAITDSGITGYAWGDSVGWINLDPTNGGVDNDGEGNLSGYAWGELTGWINFNPTNGGVTIDSNGDFAGYAWSQNYGWIIFNCDTNSSCATDDFKISTDWRPVSSRASVIACNNGSDDDGDGKIDYPSDPGCSSLTDNDETDPAGAATVAVVTAPTVPVIPPEIIEPIIDACPNIAGPQQSVPTGYIIDGFGNCIFPDGDVCTNITGIQTSVPSGLVRDALGNCIAGPLDEVDKPPLIPDVLPDIAVPDNIQNVINNLPPAVGNFVSSVYVEVGTGIRDSYVAIKDIYETPAGEFTVKAVSTAGVVAGGFVAVSSVFFNPASFTELALTPFRLWSLLLSFLGLKKRFKPWGTVYDSITKQPLDPAYVVLQDKNGKEISSSITDIDGRYGFLSEVGNYKIVVNKTNYTFPSKRLAGRSSDELYSNLYFGELLSITDAGSVITKSIPLDPVKFDWNEFAKKNKKLMKFYSKFDFVLAKISSLFFNVGFVISVVALFIAPQPYNLIMFGLYVLLLLLRLIGLKPRSYGYLSEKLSGNPLSFAIVRVFSAELNTEIAHKITDATGKYFCLVPNGSYYLKIEKKLPDESYVNVMTSKVFDVKKGIINSTLKV